MPCIFSIQESLSEDPENHIVVDALGVNNGPYTLKKQIVLSTFSEIETKLKKIEKIQKILQKELDVFIAQRLFPKKKRVKQPTSQEKETKPKERKRLTFDDEEELPTLMDTINL